MYTDPDNGGDVNTFNAPVMDAFDAAKLLAASLMDPASATSGARLIEQNDSLATCAKHTSASLSLSIANGTTAADGSCAFFLRGDGKSAITIPASISAASVVTWAGGTSYDAYDASFAAGSWFRPVVTYAKVNITTFGDKHDVRTTMYRVPPNTLANQIPQLIANTSTALGVALRSLGGEQSNSLDAYIRSYKAYGDNERKWWSLIGSDRGTSTTEGAVCWIYGLRSTDQVVLTFGMHAEYDVITNPAAHATSDYAAILPNSAASTICDLVATALTSGNHDTTFVNGDQPDATIERGFRVVNNVIDTARKKDSEESAAGTLFKVFSTGIKALELILPFFLVHTPSSLHFKRMLMRSRSDAEASHLVQLNSQTSSSSSGSASSQSVDLHIVSPQPTPRFPAREPSCTRK